MTLVWQEVTEATNPSAEYFRLRNLTVKSYSVSEREEINRGLKGLVLDIDVGGKAPIHVSIENLLGYVEGKSEVIPELVGEITRLGVMLEDVSDSQLSVVVVGGAKLVLLEQLVDFVTGVSTARYRITLSNYRGAAVIKRQARLEDF